MKKGVLLCFGFFFQLLIACCTHTQGSKDNTQESVLLPPSGIWRQNEVHSLVRKHLQPEPSNQAQIRMFLAVVTMTIMAVVVVMCVDKGSAAAVSVRNFPT